MSSAASLAVDVLETACALEAIAPEWEALWRATPDTTPFQSPQWLLPWWKHFGEDKELAVVTAREEERLVLLAPFCIHRSTLMLLGTRNADHLDVLGDASVALTALCDRGGWDVADLQLLRRSSSIVTARLPRGLTSRLRKDEIWPIAPLPPQISSHFRKRLRYDARQCEAAGALRFDDARGEEEALRAFDVLTDLHGARWSHRGEPGVFADDRTRLFHRDVVAATARCGTLRMFVLSIGARPVAAYYGFLHEEVAYYYLSGFDPQVQHLGIGNLLIAHAMESAHREGAMRFDFLRGCEDYKYRWGAADEQSVRRRIW